jgi:pilus assembly protein Flp/PilA
MAGHGGRRPRLRLVLRREEGQGLTEYALILALIAILAVAALTFFGTQLQSILSHIGSVMPA